MQIFTTNIKIITLTTHILHQSLFHVYVKKDDILIGKEK